MLRPLRVPSSYSQLCWWSLIMNRLIRYGTRLVILPGVMVLCALLAIVLHAMEVEVRLSPPGLRPINQPTLVIPADFSYPNRAISLPDYCDESGSPAAGWSSKYVETRRFASDQSAWIYFRNSDLKHLAVRQTARVWFGPSNMAGRCHPGY